MNKTSKTTKPAHPAKKLSLADLKKVVGGLPPEPKIKITVENGSGTQKASGEG
jgi:hypothetical protein